MVKHVRGGSMTVNMQLLYLFRTYIGKKSTNCNLQQWLLTTLVIVFCKTPGRLRVKMCQIFRFINDIVYYYQRYVFVT